MVGVTRVGNGRVMMAQKADSKASEDLKSAIFRIMVDLEFFFGAKMTPRGS